MKFSNKFPKSISTNCPTNMLMEIPKMKQTQRKTKNFFKGIKNRFQKKISKIFTNKLLKSIGTELSTEL